MKNMRLNDLIKILLDYIFSYTLAVIYKINLKDEQYNNRSMYQVIQRGKIFAIV